METGALKAIDSILGTGGVFGALFILACIAAFFFYKQYANVQEKRLEQIEKLSALLERSNIALASNAQSAESREQTLRTIADSLRAMADKNDANREMFRAQAERIETSLRDLHSRINGYPPRQG